MHANAYTVTPPLPQGKASKESLYNATRPWHIQSMQRKSPFHVLIGGNGKEDWGKVRHCCGNHLPDVTMVTLWQWRPPGYNERVESRWDPVSLTLNLPPPSSVADPWLIALLQTTHPPRVHVCTGLKKPSTHGGMKSSQNTFKHSIPGA